MGRLEVGTECGSHRRQQGVYAAMSYRFGARLAEGDRCEKVPKYRHVQLTLSEDMHCKDQGRKQTTWWAYRERAVWPPKGGFHHVYGERQRGARLPRKRYRGDLRGRPGTPACGIAIIAIDMQDKFVLTAQFRLTSLQLTRVPAHCCACCAQIARESTETGLAFGKVGTARTKQARRVEYSSNQLHSDSGVKLISAGRRNKQARAGGRRSRREGGGGG
jgi:hypothetical protein